MQVSCHILKKKKSLDGTENRQITLFNHLSLLRYLIKPCDNLFNFTGFKKKKKKNCKMSCTS